MKEFFLASARVFLLSLLFTISTDVGFYAGLMVAFFTNAVIGTFLDFA